MVRTEHTSNMNLAKYKVRCSVDVVVLAANCGMKLP